MRAPVRLGREVFLTQRLEAHVVEEALEAFVTFAQTLREWKVIEVRAVATSALREAQDRWLLVERVRQETGIELEVISGAEEARLVRLALLAAAPRARKGSSLLLDLGGGSLELSLLREGKVEWTTSLELGTVRLMEAFLDGGPAGSEQVHLLEEYTDRLLEEALPHLRGHHFDRVLGSGGNLEALAEILPIAARSEGTAGPVLDASGLPSLALSLARQTVEERMTLFGIRRDRAEVLLPAAVILSRLCHSLELEAVEVPGAGLRDGVLREIIARHFRVWDEEEAEEAALNGALRLGHHYAFHQAHAEKVSSLAVSLFDALKAHHSLGRRERLILRVGAMLHDIGDFVNYDRHHKHSAYLIENSDIPGFSDTERFMVSCLARYHRKTLPTARHDTFRELPQEDQRRVRWLVPLLRIADALDREHLSRVEKVGIKVDKDRLRLTLHSPHDCALEKWTLEAKADFFEEVYGLKVEARTVGKR